MKVILAGGGTGGHLYPAIAVAEQLDEKGIKFIFMVSNRGIEREVLTKLNYDFIEQRIKPFSGQNILDKIKILFSMIKEILILKKHFEVNDKVILFGGFAAAISGIIALIRGCDLYIHEQNSVMGFTNRFFSKYAKKVFLSFDNTLKAKGNILITGNPIRKNIIEAQPKEILGKTLLLIGGSQGSRVLNKTLAGSAKVLIENGYTIIHQTGKKLLDETLEEYKKYDLANSDKVEVKDYLEDINFYYEKTDIIISRAGSGSVFEIMASKRPAIFIPLKIATANHQYFNALEAVQKGCGAMIEEDNLNSKILVDKINYIYENYEEKFLPKLKDIKIKDSVNMILDGMNI